MSDETRRVRPSSGTLEIRVDDVSERIIMRDTGGRWVVLASESGPFVSSHERREEALARVATGLRQIGGGFWIMKDASGNELARGEVSALPDASAAIR
jgi:hypothetical protein